MGSYASLYIGDFELLITKNNYSDELMMLFLGNDLQYDEIDEDGEISIEPRLYYKQNIIELSERLDSLGFTYNSAKEDFSRMFDYEDYFIFYDDDLDPDVFCFEYFEYLLSIIVSNGYSSYDFDINYRERNSKKLVKEAEDHEKLLRYILDDQSDTFFLGMPLSHPYYLIRVIAKLVDKNTEVTYDLTDIYHGGWIEPDKDYPRISYENVIQNQNNYLPTIIITEGSSDSLFLEKALNHLYPHLSNLYSFFDFGISKSGGGVGEIERRLKAFIGAGIPNRIVVIFDNDTAGIEIRNKLLDSNLPDNIRVLKYPDYDLLNNYPTIGPQQDVNMNINGLAASIELYLDQEVLKTRDGLLPIMWKGYNEKLQQYQGEITDKTLVKKKFSTMLKKNPESIDWSGVKLILDAIINVFNINEEANDERVGV